MSSSLAELERMIAAGPPEDTLSCLQKLEKILQDSVETKKPVLTVPGLDGHVLAIEYSRSPPYSSEKSATGAASNDLFGKSGRILTMSSRDYVDVLECFRPFFADPSCFAAATDLTPSSTVIATTPPVVSSSPEPILRTLRGRHRDDVVPFLMGIELSAEAKVDIALQHFFATQ